MAPCDPFKHDWKEVYYGYECLKCKQFVAFGCEPWAPDEDGFQEYDVLEVEREFE